MHRPVLFAAMAALAMPPAPLLAARRDPPETQLAKLLAGRVAGKPVDCIQLDRSNDSTTIPHTAIVYRAGDTLYVNQFDNGCPQLDTDVFVITRTPTNQLCRGDAADLRENGPVIPRGTCIFGNFTPYTKPGR